MVRTERDRPAPADQAAGNPADAEPHRLRTSTPLPALAGVTFAFLAVMACGAMVWAAQKSDYLENLPFETLLIVWPAPAAIAFACSRFDGEAGESSIARSTLVLNTLGGLVWALLAGLWLAAAMQ